MGTCKNTRCAFIAVRVEQNTTVVCLSTNGRLQPITLFTVYTYCKIECIVRNKMTINAGIRPRASEEQSPRIWFDNCVFFFPLMDQMLKQR